MVQIIFITVIILPFIGQVSDGVFLVAATAEEKVDFGKEKRWQDR